MGFVRRLVPRAFGLLVLSAACGNVGVGSQSMMRLVFAQLIGVLVMGTISHAAELPSPVSESSPPASSSDPIRKSDSLFFFGGYMSTQNMGATANFNSNHPVGPNYDNYIVGAAYNHDFYSLYGFAVGGEVGLADRFGYFRECCDPVVKSTAVLHSPELWFGPRFSFDGLVLFNTVRIGGAMTFGFSATTDSIGVERRREIVKSGSARLIGYLGPEIFLALADHPEWEIVYRLHHRSGANGTFGRMGEGYNANVLGVRYRF